MSLKFYKNTPILLTLLLITLSSTALSAAPLTLSTWNIEWLTNNPNPRFPQSLRDESDFKALRNHLQSFNPDILAFQEVDSEAALRKVIGYEYKVYFSDRALPSNQQHQFSAINQFTGFAVRSDIDVINVPDFPLIKGNRLRFASGIKVINQESTINLLSLHLKAGCSGKYSNRNSCRTLKQQGRVINSWIKQVEERGESYIVLGDFNHNLAYRGDWLWEIITEGLTLAPRLVSKDTQAKCQVKSTKNSNKTYQYRSLIDHIFVSPELRTGPAIQNVMPVDAVLKYQLSDHCPLSTKLL
jgi:endonuclease/exonuclease/phosphatase family metal-dependent hydrolase